MTNAWIVVREEKHVDDRYWVCLDQEDALAIARDVTKYWLRHYDIHDSDGTDEICYGDMIFHHGEEELFDVFVEPVQVRSPGERQQETER